MRKYVEARGLFFWLAVFPAWLSLSLISLSGCQQQNPTNEIRFAIAQAPLNLDPRYATDAASERINRLIYQPLVDFDAQSKPIPALASWQVLTPARYRFSLLPQHTFHDGSQVKAADVVATYQSLLALRDSPHTAEFANIRDIHAVDDQTVEFELGQPDEGFAARLIVGIMPAALLAQNHDFSHQPIGSGPLKFVSWDGALKLERMTDKQRFTLEEVKDPTVRILKLMRGEADLLQGDLPPELVRYLQGQADIQVMTSIGANFSYLGLNMQDAQLSNLLVRQAIAHAVDRQAIITKVLADNSRAAGAILPPEHWAGNAALQPYDYNPALSRKLLEQAGITLPLKLTYKTSTDAQRVRLATIMQAQMQPAGIELEIRSLDWGTFFDDIKQGNFQLYSLNWVGIKTPEIYRLAFHSQSIPPKGANRGHFADVELDALIAKQDWPAATARVHQQLPYVPLWHEGQFAAMRKGLTNFSLKPDGNWDGLATIRRDIQRN
ncbi:MAG: ABC transporter substrate-binding protein [Candidatus Methylopumilus sp.]|jgi:peptide/nickel transport system substrate-binding protein